MSNRTAHQSKSSCYKLLLLLICAFMAVSVFAEKAKKEEPAFFVRIVPQQSEVIHGDSTIVSVVVYSSADLQSVTCTTKGELKIKGCSVRKISNDNARRVVQSRYEGRVYYTLVWSQYVVGSDEIGEYNVPVQEFTGEVRVYQRSNDPFYGFFGSYNYKDYKVKAASPKTKLTFIEKPQKTTEQLMNSTGIGVF